MNVRVAGALIVGAVCGIAQGGILWNEQINGDFSNDRLSPTALVLSEGTASIVGRIEDGGGGEHIDLDYFSLSIPAGHVLSSMLLTSYLSIDRVAFMAIEPGATYPFDPGSVGPDDLFGYTHFGPPELGANMLEVMGRNGRGFTPPLPAGVYTMWVQQTDNFTEYSMDLTVEAIPGVGTGASMVVMGCAAGRRQRRVA